MVQSGHEECKETLEEKAFRELNNKNPVIEMVIHIFFIFFIPFEVISFIKLIHIAS
jgi:hypothetical protein